MTVGVVLVERDGVHEARDVAEEGEGGNEIHPKVKPEARKYEKESKFFFLEFGRMICELIIVPPSMQNNIRRNRRK